MEESNARRIVNEMREDILGPQLAAGREGKLVFAELENLDPNTQMDFKELTQHEKYTGWRRGLLVARNVELNAGDGVKTGSEIPNLSKKVSANTCARYTGISDKTVKKYLIAWDLAAADGLVPESSSMVPGQSFEFDEEVHTADAWKSYYKPPTAPNEKNAFISLNDKVTSFNSTLEDKWDDAKAEYDDQREVSLETLRENVRSARDNLTNLLAEIDKEAKSKKYIDLNQE